MPRRQISQDVVRADIAAVLHGEEFVGLDPKNSHKRSANTCRRDVGDRLYSANIIQRTHTAFLPATKLMKATTAAELRTTKVRAGSAMRESGPILIPASAARLSA